MKFKKENKIKVVLSLLLIIFSFQNHLLAQDEKNYYLAFKPVEPFLIKMILVEGGYKIHNHFVLGPTILNLNYSDSKYRDSMNSFGGHIRYFKSGVFNNSFYFGVEILRTNRQMEVDKNSVSYKGSIKNALDWSASAGYYWFWDSYYLSMGGQYFNYESEKMNLKSAEGYNYASSTAGLYSWINILPEFKFGWLF